MTHQEKSSIVEWLYLTHDAYPSAAKWRKGLCEMLESLTIDAPALEGIGSAYPYRLDELHAIEIMGAKNVLGVASIKRVFGIEVTDVPPIPFSVDDLKRAKKLNQHLILRVDKMGNGLPCSIQKMQEDYSKGNLLHEPKWWKEYIFKGTETPHAGWALVSKDLLPDSTNNNYVDQTAVLVEHLEKEVFKGTALPEVYRKAIEEFKVKKTGLIHLISSDWKAAAKQLSELEITKLCRPSAVDAIYDMALTYDVTGTRPFPTTYTWTASLARDGVLVGAGYFDESGVDGDGCYPGTANDYLGVSLSRRV